jgi:hypothetical protein
MGAQQFRSLRHQRAKAFLPSFAKEPDLIRASQLKITSLQIQNFLDTSSRVEHRRQQNVISAVIRRGPVDSRKNRLDLVVIKIFDHTLASAFERDAQDLLNSFELIGMVSSQIAKESVNGSEPDVACRYAVFPVLLQMRKKSKDLVRPDVMQVEIGDIALSMRGQKPKKEQ